MLVGYIFMNIAPRSKIRFKTTQIMSLINIQTEVDDTFFLKVAVYIFRIA